MSDKKPRLTAKQKRFKEQRERGYFESEFDAYPGHFQLPHPFLDRHMRAWWDSVFEQRKGIDVLDYDYAEFEWSAYVLLIREHGVWEIENVPIGDIDSGGMPMVVKVWVIQEASNYLVPFWPRNRLPAMSGIL